MPRNWNPLVWTDSYKMSHFRQYPPGTEQVYSYFESRGSDPRFGFGQVVFFGLQYLLDQIAGPLVTGERIDRAERLCRLHFGNERNFNRGAGSTSGTRTKGGCRSAFGPCPRARSCRRTMC